MMKFVRRLSFLVLASSMILTSAPVFAAATTNTVPGSGLSISPLHNQLTLNPGEATSLKINVKNITQNDVTAKAYVNDFKSDNNTGNPVIITDPKITLQTSIKKFVHPSDMPLTVGEKKEFTVPVSIPPGTTPGAYYGIIRYRAIPAGSAAPKEGEVSLSASVGTIVLIQVKGDLKERAQLSALKVYNNSSSGTIFFHKPNKAGVEISNLGNSFVQPFGKVTVTNMSGKEIYSYEVNNNNPRSTVLPGTKRVFIDPIKNISKPGRYSLNASIAVGNGSEVLVAKKTFWYITGGLLLAILGILVLLVIITLLAYRQYRKSRRHTRRSRR
jgi:methionine-rich copper-binding protein CopC